MRLEPRLSVRWPLHIEPRLHHLQPRLEDPPSSAPSVATAEEAAAFLAELAQQADRLGARAVGSDWVGWRKTFGGRLCGPWMEHTADHVASSSIPPSWIEEPRHMV